MKNLVLGFFALVCIAVFAGCTLINSSDGGNLTIYPDTIGPTDSYRPIYTVDTKKRVTGEASVNVLFGLFAWGGDSELFGPWYAASSADNAEVYGFSLLSFLFPFIPDSKRISAKAAFYDACKTNNCDSLVASRYEITRKNYIIFSKCKAEVKGFPATLSTVEIVKPLPYYINTEGKMVLLKEFVKPVKLFDESRRTTVWFF
jgi:hypothetical protein